MFAALDMDGTARIVNDVVDIGAYETLFRLDVGILLQGPYQTATDDMSLSLNIGGHIPLTSPYADDIRTVSAIPSAATD